ncbi:MAG TPA: R2-like ligand-binding oxidase, partial [Candidatus Marinimicrobia bacterium]|nr:R2-like ligand-binding oxidase [Candidatus Neomarinimicrobiota bacterium]
MRTEFTTLSNGLNRNHVMSRLWEKAKKLGTWNPDDIDLSKDKTDWGNLSDSERDLTLNVATLFLSGEEAVTLDLLPLLSVVTGENRLEEEMYLTSFLWEEAKHVDFFHRYLDTVMTDSGDLSRYHTESYRAIFYETLPKAMALLKNDKSPQTQAEASVTYNIVVEGILAETGYNGWYQILQESGLLPGMLEGIKFVQRDESRHLRFGVYFISRLVAEHGDSVWDAVEKKMETL